MTRTVCLACLAACGGGHPAAPDAMDATIDVAADTSPDAAPRPVTIHAFGRELPGAGPRAGVAVLFYAPDGTLAGRTATDAKGDASGLVPDGGMVTVVEDVERTISTIADVHPGDELWVGDHWWASPVHHATISVPSGPDATNQYVAYGPCALSDFSSSPITINAWQCAPASGPVIAAAFDATSLSVLRGWMYQTDVSLVENGSATMTGAWQAPLPFSVHVTNAPTTGVWILNAARFAGGEQLYLFQSGTIGPSTSALDAQFAFVGGGDGLMTELAFDTGTGLNSVLEYRTGTPASLSGDLTSDLISRPTSASWTVGELAPGGPTGIVGGDITTSGTGDYDGAVIAVVAVDSNFDIRRWTMVTPPLPAGTTQVRLPALPADLVSVWAGTTDMTSSVILADTPATSYADFRRDAEPEHGWKWMRHPLTASKIRIGVL